MSMDVRPEVKAIEGGKCWENRFDSFELKAFIPDTKIDGKVHNYGFRAPLLLVFEENRQTVAEAVAFAKETGLADIASSVDSSVLFIYPTCQGGWENASEELYADIIKETRIHQEYDDGIISVTDFFTKEFKGYYIRGAIFRADIYSYGKSADYVATKLLKKLEGQYLWGPGEITPAMCSMERLSVIPVCERKDIAIMSVGNTKEINVSFADYENLLIKEKAEYKEDYYTFVRKFKMWCGNISLEPNFAELGMHEEPGSVVVPTSEYHKGDFVGTKEHTVGYFAYYNDDTFDKGPAPLVIGFHGGGDSSMYLTFVAGWWEVAHKYGFLFVSVENHQNVAPAEAIAVIEDIKKKYNVDSSRIYATGFSMGSGKTWDLFMEFPEILAGVAPCSALFPVKNNPFGRPMGDWLNLDVSVPVFYSGGELSPLPELPCQADTCLERVQYVAKVNRLKKKFDDLSFDKKEEWEDSIYGIKADRVEKVKDESRGSVLTINYYDSEDGVCRTAFASVDNQVHECRRHSCEMAWNFISQFTR